MMSTSTAITSRAHHGAIGSQTKFRIAEIAAATMPAKRAHVYRAAGNANHQQRQADQQVKYAPNGEVKGVDVVRQDDEPLIPDDARQASRAWNAPPTIMITPAKTATP